VRRVCPSGKRHGGTRGGGGRSLQDEPPSPCKRVPRSLPRVCFLDQSASESILLNPHPARQLPEGSAPLTAMLEALGVPPRLAPLPSISFDELREGFIQEVAGSTIATVLVVVDAFSQDARRSSVSLWECVCLLLGRVLWQRSGASLRCGG
jgi:hypothetical protein